MYTSPNFYKDKDGHFAINMGDKPFKILQLTDMHLGFGILSKNKDKLAMDAVEEII